MKIPHSRNNLNIVTITNKTKTLVLINQYIIIIILYVFHIILYVFCIIFYVFTQSLCH